MGKEPRIDPELLAQAAGVAVDVVIDDALRAALARLRRYEGLSDEERAERPAYEDVSISLDFAGEPLTLSSAEMVAVDRQVLRRARGNVRDHEDEIRRALDKVFTGF